MGSYLLRRLCLIPLTLFGIILVNFVIINLAPGEPTTISQATMQGEATREAEQTAVFGPDRRYLQMREHFGLTLPVLFNWWPWVSKERVKEQVEQLTKREEMTLQEYDKLRIYTADQARFVMPHLLALLQDKTLPKEEREFVSRLFVRGAWRPAFLGPSLTAEQKQFNREQAKTDEKMRSWAIEEGDSPAVVEEKVKAMTDWYRKNHLEYGYERGFGGKIKTLFMDTRFFRYFQRVLTLDFGTLRNDDSRYVIDEVVKRFRYSLTLSILPMIITFCLAILFGFLMAWKRETSLDLGLNALFLVLYSIPVFVAAPFLIEELALHRTFPFTDIPVPHSGFTSPDRIYDQMTSWQRLGDILRHIALPLLAVMYGGLATHSRLARTAVLEVSKQDFVRTARAKGASTGSVLFHHIGRNAAITLVTAIAGSLGIVLGGSLIVETVFQIDGFGKFFYDAVRNWDYNVIMFSALAGSFLTLVGYLLADLAYTALDPRVSLE